MTKACRRINFMMCCYTCFVYYGSCESYSTHSRPLKVEHKLWYQTCRKLWTSITPKRWTFEICWYPWLGGHIGKSLREPHYSEIPIGNPYREPISLFWQNPKMSKFQNFKLIYLLEKKVFWKTPATVSLFCPYLTVPIDRTTFDAFSQHLCWLRTTWYFATNNTAVTSDMRWPGRGRGHCCWGGPKRVRRQAQAPAVSLAWVRNNS